MTDDLRLGSPRAQWSEGRRARRLTQLVLGCVLLGASVALLVRSGLGAMPWDVLHQGLNRQFGLTLGVWLIVTGIVVVLLWIPLRQAPGIGTIVNVVLVGVAADLVLAVLPPAGGVVVGVGYLAAGTLAGGVATAAYVGARFGPGPRDGLMTGLSVRFGWPVAPVRVGIEVAVVVVGALLGGTVGVGTVVFALAVGPLVARLLPPLTVRPHA